MIPWLVAAAFLSQDPAAFEELSERRLRADVTFLASKPLDGRLSLRKGSEVAVEWIESEFAKAGLAPVADGSYLQQVPLVEYRVDREKTALKLSVGGKQVTVSPGQANFSFPAPISLKAPVVFAGFGISAPELGYDDYAGIDVKGKIVLIFDHEPQENDARSVFNGKGNTRYAGSFVKLKTAQRKGAAAVLLMAEPDRSHPSNEERRNRIPGSAARIAAIPVQALAPGEIRIPLISLAEASAFEIVAKEKLLELQRSIDRTLKPASYELAETIATLSIQMAESKALLAPNVLGLLEGSDPALKGETIVISAHYDHDGPAASVESYFPGADDNASGTAGVVALAHAFARHKPRPKRSILFAVFAAEERGLLGSYYYAANPLRPLRTTRAVINFDMIGRNEEASRQTDGLIDIAADTSNELNLVGTPYSPEYRQMVEQANRRVGMNLNYKWDSEPALNVFFRSDQYPFVLHDVPAFWWFTGFHPDYHQTTDTADRIQYAKMARILKLAFYSAEGLGNAATSPKFVAVEKQR